MKTYELKEVPEERIPAIGEIRFRILLCPMPGSMISSYPERIIWTGKEWQAI